MKKYKDYLIGAGIGICIIIILVILPLPNIIVFLTAGFLGWFCPEIGRWVLKKYGEIK